MLSSVNRDHWNERLNFTGGAMILKPFPPVVILIVLLFLDSKEWLSKPRIKTQKRKERTWQIPTAKLSWADAWSIAHILGWKLSNTVKATFHGDKKKWQKKFSSNEKRRHCLRQYFGPVHTYLLLFENEDFSLLFDLVCLVLFSPPVWPINDNSVSGDNSYRKLHLIKMLPMEEQIDNK